MAHAKGNDAIILLGLNPSAPEEARALRALGNHVTLITTGKTSDWVYVDGRGFDLSDETQLVPFMRYLRLPPERIKLAAGAIRGGISSIKDELGQLAMVWAYAERRGVIPSRFVLSGEHIAGGTFFSKGGTGILRVSDLQALAAAFPRVANSIEDLHTSACNSAIEVLSWPRIFPHLKTIWAYAGSCPGTFSGAQKHLALWDRATRGRAKTMDRLLAKTTRKGDHVVVWSPVQGMVTGEVNSLVELRARLTAAESTYDAYFDGREFVVDTGTGPMRDYYELMQTILRHPDLPEWDRSSFEKKRDTAVRLLFYDKSIKQRFAREHRITIAAGFEALGTVTPDFGRLSRKDALAAIALFERNADIRRIDATEKLRPLLTEGLRQLSNRYVPDDWI